MVLEMLKKRQRRPTKDKPLDPMNLKDEGLGQDKDEPEDEDDNDVEEVEDDESIDKDLLRTIRKLHPKNNFLDGFISRRKRNASSRQQR